jgi:alpha-1,3-rhamnosyl/mannosyltransferase
MASGVPVLLSPQAALPEVAGPAGIYLEAGEDHGWRETIIRLVEDEAEWQRHRTMGLQQAQQFSWKRCATITTAAYRLALEH